MSTCRRFAVVFCCLSVICTQALAAPWTPLAPPHDSFAGDGKSDTGMVVSPLQQPNSFVGFWIHDNKDQQFGGEIVRAISTDGGQNWSAPETIMPGANESLEVHTSPNGTVVAAWHNLANLGEIYFTRTANGGQTWSEPRPLQDESAGADYHPHLGTDGKGNWLCVWQVHAGGISGMDYDVYFSRSTDDGVNWTTKQPLNSTMKEDNGDYSGDIDEPGVLATNENGHWILCMLTTSRMGGELGEGTHVSYSHSRDNGATWSPSAILSTKPISAGPFAGHPVQLATNGSGKWAAAIHANSGALNNGTDYDVFVTTSSNDGESWSEFKLLHDYQASDSGTDSRPRLRINGDELLIVWGASEIPGHKGIAEDLVYSLSRDMGATWDGPHQIAPDPLDSTSRDIPTDVAMGANGNWLVAGHSLSRISSDGWETFVTRRVGVQVAQKVAPGKLQWPKLVTGHSPKPATPAGFGVIPSGEEVVLETDGPATFTILQSGNIEIKTTGKSTIRVKSKDGGPSGLKDVLE